MKKGKGRTVPMTKKQRSEYMRQLRIDGIKRLKKRLGAAGYKKHMSKQMGAIASAGGKARWASKK